MGNKYGFHSGVIKCKNLVFNPTGLRDTLIDSSRTLTMTTAVAAQNARNIILNNTIIGGIVGAVSKLNVIEQTITHATTDMPNLRLKCADWTIVASKNVKDLYVIQTEIDVSSAAIVSGQCAAISAAVQLTGSGVHTGEIQALYVSVGGTTTGMTCTELTVAKIGYSATTVSAKAIIEFGCAAFSNATAALELDGQGTATNFLLIPTSGGMIGSCASLTTGSYDQTATCDAALKCSIGGHTVYIPLYNAVTMT